MLTIFFSRRRSFFSFFIVMFYHKRTILIVCIWRRRICKKTTKENCCFFISIHIYYFLLVKLSFIYFFLIMYIFCCWKDLLFVLCKSTLCSVYETWWNYSAHEIRISAHVHLLFSVKCFYFSQKLTFFHIHPLPLKSVWQKWKKKKDANTFSAIFTFGIFLIDFLVAIYKFFTQHFNKFTELFFAYWNVKFSIQTIKAFQMHCVSLTIRCCIRPIHTRYTVCYNINIMPLSLPYSENVVYVYIYIFIYVYGCVDLWCLSMDQKSISV